MVEGVTREQTGQRRHWLQPAAALIPWLRAWRAIDGCSQPAPPGTAARPLHFPSAATVENRAGAAGVQARSYGEFTALRIAWCCKWLPPEGAEVAAARAMNLHGTTATALM